MSYPPTHLPVSKKADDSLRSELMSILIESGQIGVGPGGEGRLDDRPVFRISIQIANVAGACQKKKTNKNLSCCYIIFLKSFITFKSH